MTTYSAARAVVSGDAPCVTPHATHPSMPNRVLHVNGRVPVGVRATGVQNLSMASFSTQSKGANSFRMEPFGGASEMVRTELRSRCVVRYAHNGIRREDGMMLVLKLACLVFVAMMGLRVWRSRSRSDVVVLPGRPLQSLTLSGAGGSCLGEQESKRVLDFTHKASRELAKG